MKALLILTCCLALPACSTPALSEARQLSYDDCAKLMPDTLAGISTNVNRNVLIQDNFIRKCQGFEERPIF